MGQHRCIPEKACLVDHCTHARRRYIAVEMAGIMATLGTDTTLAIRFDSPLRKFDQIIQEALVEELGNIGVKLCMIRFRRFGFLLSCVFKFRESHPTDHGKSNVQLCMHGGSLLLLFSLLIVFLQTIRTAKRTHVQKVEKLADGTLTIHSEVDGGTVVTEGVDCLLWAIGRTPQSDILNLSAAGVEVDNRGYIKVCGMRFE